MVTHMKTTIELPDGLFQEAKRHAETHKTTLKSLVESGLRRVLAEQQEQSPFKLRDGSVAGNGLTPEFQGATWERIRDSIYEGRGA